MYHLTRATIFASLANASASEASGQGPLRSRRRRSKDDSGGDGEDDGRHLPAVRAS
jgi:hypothetical protein